jgi:anti-sigma B factor antagonist
MRGFAGRKVWAGGRWRRPIGAAPPEEVWMELSLATRTVAEHTVLEVGGEVDVYTAPRLRERLIELIDRGARDVVVDLGRVEFLDSTGLGVLVGALKRLRAAGGSFSLVCAKEPLLKIFRITALDQVFPLFETVGAATAAGAGGAGSAVPPTENGGAGQGNSAGPAQ